MLPRPSSRRTAWCTGAGIGVCVGLCAPTALGQQRSQEDEHVNLPAWEEPAHPLRALLQLETTLLLGWVYYLTTADLPRQFDVDYRWDTLERKLTGGSFAFDTNHFGTNFIGHPLGGAGYYLSARANGAGPLAASAVAFVGSAIWELFGEVREEISMNDTITTPTAGIAIGETTYQIARFFDRSERTLLHRGLGLLLGPFTSFNDWVDGRAPRRVASGYPTDTWHRVATHGAVLHVYEPNGQVHPEAEFQADIRLEGFRPPTKARPLALKAFESGNVTQLRAQLAMADTGFSRIEVTTQSVLAGVNYAAARDEHNSEFGYVGVGMGFVYTARSYHRKEGNPLNRLSAVRLFGLGSGHHVRRGDLTLDAWLVAAPAFGGVDPLKLTTRQLEDPRLPQVTRMHGYYMGWGVSSELEFQLGYRDLRWGGTAAFERYRSSHAPRTPRVTRMVDAFQQAQAYVGYRIPGTRAELRAYAGFRGRTSTVDQEHSSYREYTTGLQVCSVGR